MADLSAITPIDALPPELARERGLLGKVPGMSCLSDPRFSYYLFAPATYYDPTKSPPRLLVLIHGSNRNADALCEAFQTFAISHNLFLMCPLFPIGFLDPNDVDNYKNIQYQGIRYDRIILSMIDEIKARYPKVRSDEFGLYGFSGGGQFVHRFAYLHPERLLGLVVAAPGAQTRWEYGQTYPAGVQNLSQVFEGISASWERDLRAVPTAFVCGAEDTDVKWMKLRGRPIQEGGRLMAAKRLEESWRMQGAKKTSFVEVPGAAHEESKLWPLAKAFFADVLVNAKEHSAPAVDSVPSPPALVNGFLERRAEVRKGLAQQATVP